MQMRIFSTALLLLGASLPTGAAVISLDLDQTISGLAVELESLNLSGTGQLPLGQGLPQVNDGYRFVNSDLVLTESTTQTSVITGDLHVFGNIQIDPEASSILTGMLTFDLALDYQIFTVLTLTDVDPLNDYVAGMPSPIDMDPAVGGITQRLTVDLASLADGGVALGSSIDIAELLSVKVSDLGVDINGNGDNDFLEVRLTAVTAQPIIDLDVTDLIGAAGLPKVSLGLDSLYVSGQVGDVSTDPPFGPILLLAEQGAAVPAPSALALVGLGLVPLWLRSRRSRQRLQAPR